jgi:hypothetical protein
MSSHEKDLCLINQKAGFVTRLQCIYFDNLQFDSLFFYWWLQTTKWLGTDHLTWREELWFFSSKHVSCPKKNINYYRNKMKKYHIVLWTKINRKIIEAKSIALTHKYMTTHFSGFVHVLSLWTIRISMVGRIFKSQFKGLYGHMVVGFTPYLCNQCQSPLMLWVRTPFMARFTLCNIFRLCLLTRVCISIICLSISACLECKGLTFRFIFKKIILSETFL